MNTTFNSILLNAARLAGFFPNETPLASDMKAVASMALNAGLTNLVALKFPILMTTEEATVTDGFIPFGETIDPLGVDVMKFAYKEDPRTNRQTMPIMGATMYDDGVQFPDETITRVYIRYVPKFGQVDFESGTNADATIRREFERYLALLVSVDLRTEEQGKFQSQQLADAELNRLATRYGVDYNLAPLQMRTKAR